MFALAYSQHRGSNPAQQDALWNGKQVIQASKLPVCHSSLPLDDIVHVAVADGVGSSPVPHKASKLVLNILADALASGQAFSPPLIRYVHGKLCDQLAHGRSFGSSTTLTAARCEGEACQILSVGDSRAYRIDTSGCGTPLTRDHTVLNTLIANGEADPGTEYASIYQMLDSCLIADDEETDFQIHHTKTRFLPGHSLLLCTDGVHGTVGEEALIYLFDPTLSVTEQVSVWHKAVMDKGAEDNFSMLLLRHEQRSC